MKKITKSLVAIFMIAILSMTSVTSLASNEGISPRLSHANGADFSFSATSNGGHLDVTYLGYDSFVRADLTVTIEKRFLLVLWNEVGFWRTTSTDKYGHFYNLIPLDGSGKYRATFTLLITGNDGTVDTITFELEDSY